MNRKIVLGMSGGVDSTVSARLLQDAGYEVYGLFMDIGMPNGARDALSAAKEVGIPLKVLDISSELEQKVCTPFVEAYLRGETPNPCIMCNPTVKFKSLLEYAREIGAEHIATGHYARVRDGRLYKGAPKNDQSYMLCRMTKEQLQHLVLPLGDYEKSQIRTLAAEMGLKVVAKPDSMEICFIPDGDYAAFIDSRGQSPGPGNFVDERGNVLGRHGGIHHYTIGQRRGLGISLGRRVFVSAIRPETNEVVISDGEGLYATEIRARDMNWLLPEIPAAPFTAGVRVRHSRFETPAIVTPEGGGESVTIVFESPVRAPTPGQSAVLYDGDVVMGGGYIV
ncbi:MAG TPA: tRNA 2-thiouridine(34) synthase MnmA [Clostridiales bacterium]|nr:tRNA 2-thiouridine(34) synthase MnmA [Clostridiales bacterium]